MIEHLLHSFSEKIIRKIGRIVQMILPGEGERGEEKTGGSEGEKKATEIHQYRHSRSKAARKTGTCL